MKNNHRLINRDRSIFSINQRWIQIKLGFNWLKWYLSRNWRRGRQEKWRSFCPSRILLAEPPFFKRIWIWVQIQLGKKMWINNQIHIFTSKRLDDLRVWVSNQNLFVFVKFATVWKGSGVGSVKPKCNLFSRWSIGLIQYYRIHIVSMGLSNVVKINKDY
jgi:hypothetical protein